MLCGAFTAASTLASNAEAAVPFTGTAYTQNFDSLGDSGALSWANDSTLPGWSLFRRPAPGTALTSITGGSGGSNAGAFYSFGSAAGERALGGVGSGGTYWGSPATNSVAGWLAASFTNDTTAEISSFNVSYDGEQWRDGGNTSPQTMVFEYGFGSSFTAVSFWTAPGGTFDFISPHTTATGALDGNDAANRVAGLGGTISSSWPAGETLWLRWIEHNDAGNDHGMAVDNFALSSAIVPPVGLPGDYNDDDVVDALDYVVWRKSMETQSPLANETKSPGAVDDEDYTEWFGNFGATPPAGGAGLSVQHATVPEPSMSILVLSAFAAMSLRQRVRSAIC